MRLKITTAGNSAGIILRETALAEWLRTYLTSLRTDTIHEADSSYSAKSKKPAKEPKFQVVVEIRII